MKIYKVESLEPNQIKGNIKKMIVRVDNKEEAFKEYLEACKLLNQGIENVKVEEVKNTLISIEF